MTFTHKIKFIKYINVGVIAMNCWLDRYNYGLVTNQLGLQ